ncbi:hypothetical protein SSX86_001085 [Deinandra increscens subsp. villosa]|uniref:RBR-type E3 ubiquitin transferase n=1 Tax=Deinandra increscens subsp. villosa TaxID=3103831 RepID=A0AAP0DQZ7_9ASTR
MHESEWRKMQKNLNRLMHDKLFSGRILDAPPENEWRRTDDDFTKRIGSYQPSNSDDRFKVYSKGLVSGKPKIGGVGVAIYDARDRCVFELRKQFLIGDTEDGDRTPADGDLMEIRGLIEGVYSAVTFGLKRVDVYCDNKSVYQYLTGKNKPTKKIAVKLVDALILIQRKIGYHVHRSSATQKKVKFTYKLAKNAIKPAKTALEQCTICFENICRDEMFSVDKCLHRYCYSCMNKHVESKLRQWQLPGCPYETCSSKLELKSCKKVLNKKLYDIMSSRVKEASIPPTERVYCPFSKCSFLMSKTDLQNAVSKETGKRKCSKCHRLFCINCKVPWHDKSTCSEYMKDFPNEFADVVELESLATRNHWRQCIECKHMIELAAGCHHITCRCGYQFCYSCGAGWSNKRCSCPAWDEGYILYDAQR